MRCVKDHNGVHDWTECGKGEKLRTVLDVRKYTISVVQVKTNFLLLTGSFSLTLTCVARMEQIYLKCRSESGDVEQLAPCTWMALQPSAQQIRTTRVRDLHQVCLEAACMHVSGEMKARQYAGYQTPAIQCERANKRMHQNPCMLLLAGTRFQAGAVVGHL